jgi:hypothetical protein
VVKGAGERIVEIVAGWPGIEVHPHRFGGKEFRLGKREIGHIHEDWLVDIPFPVKVRDEVIAAGLAEPHHILPDSGWISCYLREEADIPTALQLYRRSYDLAINQKAKKLDTGVVEDD